MTLPEIVAFATGPALPLVAAGWALKAALTYGALRLWARRRAARLALAKARAPGLESPRPGQPR